VINIPAGLATLVAGQLNPFFQRLASLPNIRERRSGGGGRGGCRRTVPQWQRSYAESRLIVSYLPDPERHPLWEGIKALLEPATDGAPVLTKNELVWVAFDGPVLFGAATTILYNDGEAEVRLCGGKYAAQWLGLGEATVSAWARDCGAAKLITRGRKGWARVFPPGGPPPELRTEKLFSRRFCNGR
jgi:hypothetical protein